MIGGEALTFSQSFPAQIVELALMRLSQEVFLLITHLGACPTCFGLGYKMEFDEDLMIPDKSLSIDEERLLF